MAVRDLYPSLEFWLGTLKDMGTHFLDTQGNFFEKSQIDGLKRFEEEIFNVEQQLSDEGFSWWDYELPCLSVERDKDINYIKGLYFKLADVEGFEKKWNFAKGNKPENQSKEPKKSTRKIGQTEKSKWIEKNVQEWIEFAKKKLEENPNISKNEVARRIYKKPMYQFKGKPLSVSTIRRWIVKELIWPPDSNKPGIRRKK